MDHVSPNQATFSHQPMPHQGICSLTKQAAGKQQTGFST
jgi:hypothetical protein